MKAERKKNEILKFLNLYIKEVIDNPGIIITVLDVNIPSKKGVMNIYLSIFPEKFTKEVINLLKKEERKLKNILKLSKILRYLPKKIYFYNLANLKLLEEVDKILK
jgi:ribosome-binding factor A